MRCCVLLERKPDTRALEPQKPGAGPRLPMSGPGTASPAPVMGCHMPLAGRLGGAQPRSICPRFPRAPALIAGLARPERRVAPPPRAFGLNRGTTRRTGGGRLVSPPARCCVDFGRALLFNLQIS